ncbi:MAG: NAD(P)(+) transhydrogenase (Re/Si-specific) subunit beta [Candidatus Woesearchaeota archaeon]|nr:NAD(P)(+) transhydrogenase (Re/Si-specific) subunit beta [Candidatus Woesearchaeota archaeon]
MILAELIYVVSAVLFILSLRWMSEVKTSRRGNFAGASGMILAIIATIMAAGLQRYDIVIIAVVIGGVAGAAMALKMPMTAVPQRTAISHAFGALAAALVGTAEYFQYTPKIDTFTMIILAAEVILGYLTFTGSIIAFAKLQGLISGRPFIYPGRRIISAVVFISAIAAGAYLLFNPANTLMFLIMAALALVFGVLLVMAIGGADMPTVIAILNSFAGLSAAGLGFVLNNKVLIVAGALDGSSGLILAILMCKAMNRSFANVLFGGFGSAAKSTVSKDSAEKNIKSMDVEEAAPILAYAHSLIIVPGYGMAVAQAQHAVYDLMDTLEKKGVKVDFAIHPVAGRMPGHMNVLLAEADVPYDKLKEMDHINHEFKHTDVALIVGANDIVNPAATQNKGSPIYGMPILKAYEAKTVMVIKRSAGGAGFSGISNELFGYPNTVMVYGDAKEVINKLIQNIREM